LENFNKYKNPGHITIRDFYIYIMLFAVKGI
jgi:hypothetical protein